MEVCRRWVFERVAEGLLYAPAASHHGSRGRDDHGNDDADRSSAHSDGDVAAPPLRASTSSTMPLCAQRVRKELASNVLLDADGTPLSPDEAAAVTTWRSHHAFSARCARVVSSNVEAVAAPATTTCAGAAAAKGTAVADVDRDAGTDGHRSRDDEATGVAWSVAFGMRAAMDADMHIMLGVAPRYCAQTRVDAEYTTHCADVRAGNAHSVGGDAQQHTSASAAVAAETAGGCEGAATAEERALYDARMLGTPLLWEEPYAVALECTQRGLYWWSDTWQLYGRAAATATATATTTTTTTTNYVDECSSSSSGGGGSKRAAVRYVRLQWRLNTAAACSSSAAVTAAVTAADTAPTRTATISVATAQHGDAAARSSADGGHHVNECATTTTAAALQWVTAHEMTLPLDHYAATQLRFVPYVTLMHSGDEVWLMDDHGNTAA